MSVGQGPFFVVVVVVASLAVVDSLAAFEGS